MHTCWRIWFCIPLLSHAASLKSSSSSNDRSGPASNAPAPTVTAPPRCPRWLLKGKSDSRRLPRWKMSISSTENARAMNINWSYTRPNWSTEPFSNELVSCGGFGLWCCWECSLFRRSSCDMTQIGRPLGRGICRHVKQISLEQYMLLEYVRVVSSCVPMLSGPLSMPSTLHWAPTSINLCTVPGSKHVSRRGTSLL